MDTFLSQQRRSGKYSPENKDTTQVRSSTIRQYHSVRLTCTSKDTPVPCGPSLRWKGIRASCPYRTTRPGRHPQAPPRNVFSVRNRVRESNNESSSNSNSKIKRKIGTTTTTTTKAFAPIGGRGHGPSPLCCGRVRDLIALDILLNFNVCVVSKPTPKSEL